MNPSPLLPFIPECTRRIALNEGRKLQRYRDSLGIWSLGIGFNLERGDAAAMLRACGINYADVMADGLITPAQADALFARAFAPIQDAARASLAHGVYDALTDARRFVILDLEYNLGQRGWLGFDTTRALLNEAQAHKNAGRMPIAHALFNLAGDHLHASAWNGQVGDRATRDIQMIRTGSWVPAS